MYVSSSENGDSTCFKGYVLVHSDCITEHPRYSGLYNECLFLKVLKSKIKVLADQVSSHGREKNNFFGVFPYKITGPVHEALFS